MLIVHVPRRRSSLEMNAASHLEHPAASYVVMPRPVLCKYLSRSRSQAHHQVCCDRDVTVDGENAGSCAVVVLLPHGCVLQKGPERCPNELLPLVQAL